MNRKPFETYIRDQYDDDCRVNDTINMGMLLMRLGGKIMS
ncbi:unnamed protein product [Brassica oleracea]